MDGALTVSPSDAELPSGLITFLLSDVVGSTRLWEATPDLMTDCLERHDHVISDAVTGNGGVLLKSKGEGDSTFSVFKRPTDAAAAALAAQRAMFDEPWPDECKIAVRIALHTGEAIERDRDYFGRTVNRAARLRAIAGPGDVLASKVTADLVANRLPAGARLIELGVEQLRDLDSPETVYLLTERDDVARRAAAGTATEKLPLPSRLRAATTQPFVGREEERSRIEEAWARVAEGHPAFVVLEGAPGIGKSRLAAEVASSLYDRGATVLAGRCDDFSGSPFQPFADAFRFVAERTSPRARLASGDRTAALAQAGAGPRPRESRRTRRHRCRARARTALRGVGCVVRVAVRDRAGGARGRRPALGHGDDRANARSPSARRVGEQDARAGDGPHGGDDRQPGPRPRDECASLRVHVRPDRAGWPVPDGDRVAAEQRAGGFPCRRVRRCMR